MHSHFPVQESLILRCISKLAEIPSGIGEIAKLRHIQLEECSVPAAISAMRILVEQESLGNEDLQLEVRLWHQEDHQSFREMVQEEDLNSNNLRLSNPYKYGSNVRHGEKKLKKKTEDAKDKPNTPSTAFFVFMDDFAKQYKEKHPNNRSIAAIGKAGGDKWRSMSEENDRKRLRSWLRQRSGTRYMNESWKPTTVNWPKVVTMILTTQCRR